MLNFKKSLQLVIVLSVLFVVILSVGFVFSPKENIENYEVVIDTESPVIVQTSVEAKKAIYSLDGFLGIGVNLHYASDKYVIFHAAKRLFVYDLSTEKIINSLDLESLGCGSIQGDGTCIAEVSQDGSTMYLYPADANKLHPDKMYVFNTGIPNGTSGNMTLYETAYVPMENAFMNHNNFGTFSNFEDGWKLGSLKYKTQNKDYAVFE